jgi:hypothetical protein
MPVLTLQRHQLLGLLALGALATAACAPDHDPSLAPTRQQQAALGQPPVALEQRLTLDPDEATLLQLQGFDPENETLTFRIVTAPLHGQITTDPRSGLFVYTPTNGYQGLDRLRFVANDGTSDSAPAEVLFEIGDFNRPPSGVPQERAVAVNTALPITLQGLDLNNDPLQFTILEDPAYGTIEGSPPQVTYTPRQDFSGVDRFTFQVTDGALTSAPAEVLIQVGDNRPPTATPALVILGQGESRGFVLTGMDPDGDNLSFEVISEPMRGSLAGVAPNLTYTPEPDFVGLDSFLFVARDGNQPSAPVLLELLVRDLNQAPTAQAVEVRVTPGQARAITLQGADPEGSPLTFTIELGPTNGALSGVPPLVTYTPNLGFEGIDGFAFSVSDGSRASEAAQVTLLVGDVNRAPLAQSQSLMTPEERALSFTLSGTDPDGDELTYEIVTRPAHGALEGTPPALTWRPERDFVGLDQLEFRVSDGALRSGIAVIGLTATPVNDAPLAAPLNLSVGERQPYSFVLQGEDPDGDALTFEIVDAPAEGVLEGTPPALTYTPREGFAGQDRLTFRVSDGELASAPAEVTFEVLNTDNQPPLAAGGAVTTAEDTAAPLVLQASDPDGDPLTWLILRSPAHGALEGAPPNLTWRPEADYHGMDSLRFQVSDGRALSEAVEVALAVTPVNDAPTAQGEAAVVRAGETLALTLRARDADGDALTYEIVRAPAQGQLGGAAPSLTYAPSPGFAGQDSLRFRARDGAGASAEAEVQITVLPADQPNRAPSAQGGAHGGPEGRPVAFTLQATDPDGDDLQYEITAFPMRGTLQGSPPALVYAPAANFAGMDSLRFRVSDGALRSEEATVTFTISPVNDPPEALELAFFTVANEAVRVTLIGDDPEGAPLSYELLSEPAAGALEGAAPALTYRPNPGFRGEDRFSFRVSDGENSSAPATITILVGGFNTPPRVMDLQLTTAQDAPLDFLLEGSDPDGDTLTWLISAPPTRGVLTGDAPALRYTPREGFVGQDSLQFIVSDGQEFVTGTVTITVAAIERAAPTVTIHNPAGWAPAPVTLDARVQDDRCDRLPRLVVAPMIPGIALIPDGESAWRVQSAPLPVGITALTLRASSGCSALGAQTSVTLGVDASPPEIALPFAAQHPVVIEDIDTWPVAGGDVDVRGMALLRDQGAGLSSATLTLRNEGRFVMELVTYTAAPGPGLLPQGPAQALASLCPNGRLCQGDGLRLEALDSGAYRIDVALTDLAGQERALEVPFVFWTPREALERWRARLLSSAEVAPLAQAARARAVGHLEVALDALDAGRWGELLLSVEEALREQGVAEGEDPAARDEVAGRQALWLLRLALLGRLGEASGPAARAQAEGFFEEARLHLGLGARQDAALSLGRAWYWIALPAETGGDGAALLGGVLGELDALLLEAPPGRVELARVRGELAQVAPLLAQAPGALLPRELAQVMEVLTDALLALKGLEEAPVWTRHWQWALAQALAPALDALRGRSLGALGPDHALAPLARAQGEALEGALTPARLDEWSSLAQEERCLQGALYNLWQDVAREAPARCCADLEGYRALEPTVTLPDACR